MLRLIQFKVTEIKKVDALPVILELTFVSICEFVFLTKQKMSSISTDVIYKPPNQTRFFGQIITGSRG